MNENAGVQRENPVHLLAFCHSRKRPCNRISRTEHMALSWAMSHLKQQRAGLWGPFCGIIAQ